MSEEILKRNNVKVSGRGTRPMLFAHGFGCDQNMWRFVAPAFENDYRVVILDVTGVRSMGADVVQHLTRAAAAVRLMGAECVLTGIGAGIARTLVSVGADLSGVEVRRTLADGLHLAVGAAGK
jgi:anti-anti-sigma regulatory factor